MPQLTGKLVVFHVAPPCASFSRARDRNKRTRLRCSAFPGGWYSDPVTLYGNAIAKNTAMAVDFLISRFDAAGSWEQPLGSYMMPFLDSIDALAQPPTSTVVLHQCRFGRPYKKPTAFYCFNGFLLRQLDRRCSPSSSCGRQWHQSLGFGATPTGPAAAYPAALCSAFAAAVAAHLRRHRSSRVIDSATVVQEGKVSRHHVRGSTSLSLKEKRAHEDSLARAGLAASVPNNHKDGYRTPLRLLGSATADRCSQLLRHCCRMVRLRADHEEGAEHYSALSPAAL